MTRITKDVRNGWTAETRFSMPEIGERYFLQLHTMKRYDGQLVTTASVNERTSDGMGYTHRFGAIAGDYLSKRIAEKVRVTEKAVATQHAAALQQIEQIKAEAKAHYDATVAA